MESCKFKVSANNVDHQVIFESLKSIGNPTQVEYREIEGIHIIFSQSFYLRINSDLLTVIIIKPQSGGQSEIEVISGGGRSGIPMIGLGAESNEIEQIRKKLISICTDHKWTLDA